jgi:hypothetical protein
LLFSWHSVGPEDAFSVVCDDGGDVIKLVQLAPLRWKKPRRIFMTDLFADFILDEWIDRVFAVMDHLWCSVRLANMHGGGPVDTPRSPPSAISR